jgi:molybdopterin molybdotransferase
VLLAKGARLDGVALALAAAAGIDPIAVARRPRVAILATGDELAKPGAALGVDQIFESVSFGIAALVQSWGGEARRVSASADDLETTTRALESAGENADLIVTIGGASVGDYDLVKPAAKARGAALLVENVAVRPGKPVWFARAGALCFLGLPGNPASALVCAHLFLRPLLERWAGRAGAVEIVRARLAAPLPTNGPREHYIRARLTFDEEARLSVTPFESQDSARLTVFQRANALIRMAPRAAAAQIGAIVDVVLVERL